MAEKSDVRLASNLSQDNEPELSYSSVPHVSSTV